MRERGSKEWRSLRLTLHFAGHNSETRSMKIRFEAKRSLCLCIFATVGGSCVLGMQTASTAEPQALPRAACIAPEQPRPGAVTAPDSVIIVLPRAIDRRGCPIRTQHGTRIFRTVDQVATWTTAGQGETIDNSYQLPGLVAAVQRSGSQTLVTVRDGRQIALPWNAVIHPADGNAFSLGFFAPGRPIPREFQGVIPDYVVP